MYLAHLVVQQLLLLRIARDQDRRPIEIQLSLTPFLTLIVSVSSMGRTVCPPRGRVERSQCTHQASPRRVRSCCQLHPWSINQRPDSPRGILQRDLAERLGCTLPILFLLEQMRVQASNAGDLSSNRYHKHHLGTHLLITPSSTSTFQHPFDHFHSPILAVFAAEHFGSELLPLRVPGTCFCDGRRWLITASRT